MVLTTTCRTDEAAGRRDGAAQPAAARARRSALGRRELYVPGARGVRAVAHAGPVPARRRARGPGDRGRAGGSAVGGGQEASGRSAHGDGLLLVRARRDAAAPAAHRVVPRPVGPAGAHLLLSRVHGVRRRGLPTRAGPGRRRRVLAVLRGAAGHVGRTARRGLRRRDHADRRPGARGTRARRERRRRRHRPLVAAQLAAQGVARRCPPPRLRAAAVERADPRQDPGGAARRDPRAADRRELHRVGAPGFGRPRPRRLAAVEGRPVGADRRRGVPDRAGPDDRHRRHGAVAARTPSSRPSPRR